MSERLSVSPYSPPRAGRSAGLWRAWFGYCRVSRRFGRLFVAPVEKVAAGCMILPVLCVPLLGVCRAGQPLLRRLGPPLFALAAVFALACVGQTGAGIALGLMAAIHAMGVADYLDEHDPVESGARRTLRRGGLALFSAILALQLGPLATRWLVIPIGSTQGVLLFSPLARRPPFARDSAVAFQLPDYRAAGVRIDQCVGLGRVIACPGDQVRFSPGVVTVNGVPRPALPLMPQSGAMHLPAGQTLVWPVDLQTSWRGFRGILNPRDFVVLDSALVGRPYKRWFWRTFNP